MLEQVGRTIPDDDPQAETKQRYEAQIERALLAIWRKYGRRLIDWLRDNKEIKRQDARARIVEDLDSYKEARVTLRLVESVAGNVGRAELWDDLEQELKQLLLPGFEDMMQDAARDALEQIPFSIGVNWDLVNTEAAEWAADYVGGLIKGINKTTKGRVRRYIQNWIESGETLQALEKRMLDLFDAPWRAKMVAVTEVTRAFAEANERAWQSSRVIEKKQWQTAADDLVCPICGPLQGVTRKLGASFPGGIDNPPAHPRCRCWLVPVVGSG